MADPLSVAGLAVGVVSLGLQVAGGITDYIDALNCRGQDISSVRQQNDSLLKTLRAVETSLSKLGRDHQDATAAVREWLDSCEKELKALESLVVNFTACDQPTTGRKNKVKNKGKKLLYPFSRPKLEQLETRLRNANAALQLALQTLGLSVSQLGTEKLATLEATSHNISTSFVAVQSEISAMSVPLQGIHSTLSGVETRFDSFENLLKQLLVQQPAGSGSPQEITPAVATGRLLAKPAVLRDICDAAGTRARPRSSEVLPAIDHGATQIGSTVSTDTGGRFSYLCRHRRRLQRKNVVWGSLTLSLETAAEQHLPGCAAAQIITSTDRSRKISLTYIGLRRLLNSAVQLSFAISSGAGGWSFSPNFTYYPTVDRETAPVFKILFLLSVSASRCLKMIWAEKLLPSAVSAILKLFRAKKASPQAVDANNRSLVHYLADCIAISRTEPEQHSPSLAEPSPLLTLLECLIVNKAPANEYDVFGNTPLHDMCEIDFIVDPLRAAAAELIFRSNAEANVACLPRTRRIRLSATFHFLACSTRIAEAYGCGPLSLAILSDNLEQVRHLVKNHPATLAERTLFGQTPLHLAADKPICLRLLIEAADARLLNQTTTDYLYGHSAVETALILSGWHCREPTNRRMCRRCRCAECVVILLKADCALPVPADLQELLNYASQRCKLRYIRHVKDRRDRLKQLALDSLPAMEVERLGLVPGSALDSLAPRVFQLLQHHNVQIPEALAVIKTGSINISSPPSSVYQALRWPQDAELFFWLGFHDTDSWYNAEATDAGNFDFMHLDLAYLYQRNLTYLHWLAKHGAISCQLKSIESGRDILVAFYIFWRIGREFQYRKSHRFPGSNDEAILESPLATCRAWIHELNAAALSANIVDACRCKCSPGGCNPLISLLKGMLRLYDHRYKPDTAEDTDPQKIALRRI